MFEARVLPSLVLQRDSRVSAHGGGWDADAAYMEGYKNVLVR